MNVRVLSYVLGIQTLLRISAALKKLKSVTAVGRKNCDVKLLRGGSGQLCIRGEDREISWYMGSLMWVLGG